MFYILISCIYKVNFKPVLKLTLYMQDINFVDVSS